jgi:uncharacterized membrane protein
VAEEQQAAPAPAASSGSDVEQNKVIAAIGYIGILFLIPLLAKRDSAFAQYHAKQGLVLFVFGIICGIISAVPFIGWILGPVGYLISFILFIIGLVNAFGGKTAPLPIIGKYGENIKI